MIEIADLKCNCGSNKIGSEIEVLNCLLENQDEKNPSAFNDIGIECLHNLLEASSRP
jgi:hypothetical protein